jgi:hypothetical protein
MGDTQHPTTGNMVAQRHKTVPCRTDADENEPEMAEFRCTPHSHPIDASSQNLRRGLPRNPRKKRHSQTVKSAFTTNDASTTSWSDLFSSIPANRLFSSIPATPRLQPPPPPPPPDATAPVTDKAFDDETDDFFNDKPEPPSPDLPNQNRFRLDPPSTDDATLQLVDDELEPPPAYPHADFWTNKFGLELPEDPITDYEDPSTDYLIQEACQLTPNHDLQSKSFGVALLSPKDTRALFGPATANPTPLLLLGAAHLLRPLFRALNGFLSFPTPPPDCRNKFCSKTTVPLLIMTMIRDARITKFFHRRGRPPDNPTPSSQEGDVTDLPLPELV